jgi:GTP-binding protein HflX
MYNDDFDLLDDLEIETELEEWEVLPSDTETAFLASMGRQGDKPEEIEANLEELERLADTAEITVLGKYYQRKNKPDKGTYFGKGWLEETKEKMLQAGATLLIVNEELSPMQGRNIEADFGIRVIDRTEVILKIFHNHAKTGESRLQVRLAELQYQLPRLRKLWGHFDKERGSARSAGGTASRGMGEKQIEVDRRIIKRDIAKIQRILQQIIKQKTTQRKNRTNVKKVCLVGYTNAGKSTLFNALTNAGVLVEDKLFATLDSTTRQLKMDIGGNIVISDTVGFISNLPHHLVASFKATLMEVEDADLLLHIVDCADERFEEYIHQVDTVLKEIHADEIRQLLVMNKIDKLDDNWQSLLRKRFPFAVHISAVNGMNLDGIRNQIDNILFEAVPCKLLIPYTEQKYVSKLHETAKIISEEYVENGVELDVILSGAEKYLYEQFIVKP